MKKTLIAEIDYNSEDIEYESEFFEESLQNELDLKNLKNGIILFGHKLDWRSRDGISHVERPNSSLIMQKISGFHPSLIELHKNGKELYLKFYSHDVPTGITLIIRSDTKYLDKNNYFNESKALKDLKEIFSDKNSKDKDIGI